MKFGRKLVKKRFILGKWQSVGMNLNVAAICLIFTLVQNGKYLKQTWTQYLIRPAIRSFVLSVVFYLVYCYINLGPGFVMDLFKLKTWLDMPHLFLHIFSYTFFMIGIVALVKAGNDRRRIFLLEFPLILVFSLAFAWGCQLYFERWLYAGQMTEEWQFERVRQVTGFDFLIFLFIYLYYRLEGSQHQAMEGEVQRQIMEKEVAQAQLEAIRAQLNPHFLFNNLNVLSSLIEIDPAQSQIFLERLSGTYRYVLEHKDRDLIDLGTEIRFIRGYAFLLETRFGDNFHCRIETEGDLSSFLIPPLALQILVENAVNHNIISDEDPLEVHIRLDAERSVLEVGNRIKPRLEPVKGTGFGIQSLLKRYESLGALRPSFINDGETYKAILPLNRQNDRHGLPSH